MSGGPTTPQRFAAIWRGVQLSARASVQQHALDLGTPNDHATLPMVASAAPVLDQRSTASPPSRARIGVAGSNVTRPGGERGA